MKRALFFALASILMLGFLFVADRSVKWAGIERFQTWLELHPRGFMMNQSGGIAWQEFQGREITYTFYQDRLRRSFEPDSGPRVLLLGDSFCFGLYINDNETIASQLNNDSRLQSGNVFLNGGVGGTGTADHIALLEHFAGIWKPDMVVVLLNSDDIDRAIAKNLWVVVSDSLVPSIRWEATFLQKSVRSLPFYRFAQRHSYAWCAMEKILWTHGFFKDYWMEADASTRLRPTNEQLDLSSGYGQKLGELLFERMAQKARASDFSFAVMYTGLTPADSASAYTKQFLRGAPAFFERMHVPFYDPTDDWHREHGADLKRFTLYPDSHPNPEGAFVLATYLHRFSAKWEDGFSSKTSSSH
jgi:hypothetical protein